MSSDHKNLISEDTLNKLSQILFHTVERTNKKNSI